MVDMAQVMGGSKIGPSVIKVSDVKTSSTWARVSGVGNGPGEVQFTWGVGTGVGEGGPQYGSGRDHAQIGEFTPDKLTEKMSTK